MSWKLSGLEWFGLPMAIDSTLEEGVFGFKQKGNSHWFWLKRVIYRGVHVEFSACTLYEKRQGTPFTLSGPWSKLE